MTDTATTSVLYTVYDPQGWIAPERGLSVEEAAREILRHDGHLFEVRASAEHAGWWELHRSEGSTAGYGGAGQMRFIFGTFVQAADEQDAWKKIAQRIVNDSGWRLEAMPDADFAAREAEALAEEHD